MSNSIAIGVAYSDQAISGGTVDNTPIGGTTPAAGAFTTLTSSGDTFLGDAASDLIKFYGEGSGSAQATAILTALTTGVGTALVGFASTAQLQALVDSVNAVIVYLRAVGMVNT